MINNELADLTNEKEKIKLWFSGHTHFSYDFMRDNIRFVANQIGYRNEEVHFGNGLIECFFD